VKLDGATTFEEAIFLIVFFALVFFVPAIVVWATYSERGGLKNFDLRELWMHQNRIDKFAVIILGTWWIHSSSMIMWTLLRTVLTQDYATYSGIWGAAVIAKIYFSPERQHPQDPPPKE